MSDRAHNNDRNYKKVGEELIKTVEEALAKANENKSSDHPGWEIGPLIRQLEAGLSLSDLGAPQPTEAEEDQGAAATPICCEDYDFYLPGIEDKPLEAMLNFGIPAGLFSEKRNAGSESSKERSEEEEGKGKESDETEDDRKIDEGF